MVHQTPPAPLVEALLLIIKELTTQLSEARDDYNHLKADMAAHDARLLAIEQHLSNSDSNPITPSVASHMDVSPTESAHDSSTVISPATSPNIPNITSAPQ